MRAFTAESLTLLLLGLVAGGCDRGTKPEAEPTGAEAPELGTDYEDPEGTGEGKESADSDKEGAKDEDEDDEAQRIEDDEKPAPKSKPAPSGSTGAIEMKEVPKAVPSGEPSKTAKTKEHSCAPGGCAPGKCG